MSMQDSNAMMETHKVAINAQIFVKLKNVGTAGQILEKTVMMATKMTKMDAFHALKLHAVMVLSIKKVKRNVMMRMMMMKMIAPTHA